MMKNILIWACKIFLTLCGFLLLYGGFMWSFMPDANLTQYSIEIGSALGMNMVKTDIGAPLLTGGLFLLLFIFKGNQWFLPMFILGSAYLVVRVISLFVDGSAPVIIFGIALETLVLLALFGLKKLRA